MDKKFLIYLMCFHFAAYTMDTKDENNKSLSLFECFGLSKDFSQCLDASQDLQSTICSHVCRDKQFWYVDKEIKDARFASFDTTGKSLLIGYDYCINIFYVGKDEAYCNFFHK